jgi:hypothetical protein
MSPTYLISVQNIFKYTTIDSNTDPNLILPNILVAQDIHIQSILGQQLYQRFLSDITNTGTTTGQYLILLNNFIQPALAHYTVYESIDDIADRLTNKGVLEKTGGDIINSANSSEKRIQALKSRSLQRGDWYNQRIRTYIINDPNAFPEYYTQIGIEQIVAKRTTYGKRMSPNYKKPGLWPNSTCCGGPTGFPINL